MAGASTPTPVLLPLCLPLFWLLPSPALTASDWTSTTKAWLPPLPSNASLDPQAGPFPTTAPSAHYQWDSSGGLASRRWWRRARRQIPSQTMIWTQTLWVTSLCCVARSLCPSAAAPESRFFFALGTPPRLRLRWGNKLTPFPFAFFSLPWSSTSFRNRCSEATQKSRVLRWYLGWFRVLFNAKVRVGVE